MDNIKAGEGFFPGLPALDSLWEGLDSIEQMCYNYTRGWGVVKGWLTIVTFYGIMKKEPLRTDVQNERSEIGWPELVSVWQVKAVVDCLRFEAQAEY